MSIQITRDMEVMVFKVSILEVMVFKVSIPLDKFKFIDSISLDMFQSTPVFSIQRVQAKALLLGW